MCVHECIYRAGMGHGDPAWQCMLFRFVCVHDCVLVYVHVTATLMTGYPVFLSLSPLSSVLLPFSSLCQSPCEHMCVASMLLGLVSEFLALCVLLPETKQSN